MTRLLTLLTLLMLLTTGCLAHHRHVTVYIAECYCVKKHAACAKCGTRQRPYKEKCHCKSLYGKCVKRHRTVYPKRRKPGHARR